MQGEFSRELMDELLFLSSSSVVSGVRLDLKGMARFFFFFFVTLPDVPAV
jgi:hypothetical protein